MLYPSLAQLCAWYSWMHRDQASLAINPLTRCLFTSREKEASTPVIIPSDHITFSSSLLGGAYITIVLLHLLLTGMHASLALLKTLGNGRPIISYPTLRPSRVCHSSRPPFSRFVDCHFPLRGSSDWTRLSPGWYIRDLSYPVITSPQLPVSEDFSVTISYLCCILLLINQECVKANPEDSRAGVSRPTIKK